MMILLPPAVSCRICILKGQDTANVQDGIRTVFIFQLSGTSKTAAAVEFADMLFHPGNWSDVPQALRPAIANGYLATVVTSDTMFIGGVFNGHLSTTPSQTLG